MPHWPERVLDAIGRWSVVEIRVATQGGQDNSFLIVSGLVAIETGVMLVPRPRETVQPVRESQARQRDAGGSVWLRLGG